MAMTVVMVVVLTMMVVVVMDDIGSGGSPPGWEEGVRPYGAPERAKKVEISKARIKAR